MDTLSLIRTLGGLGIVLGILSGALWVVRHYDLRLPGRSVVPRDRRLELVETLSIDTKRLVALVRRDGLEHVILIAPEGHLVLESAVRREAANSAAADPVSNPQSEDEILRDQQHAWQKETNALSSDAIVTRAAQLFAPQVERPPALDAMPLPDRVPPIVKHRRHLQATSPNTTPEFVSTDKTRSRRRRHSSREKQVA